MAAIHQSVTEELAMQEGFNVDRRRLCGAAAAAVAAGPVGLAGLLFSERSTAMNYNVKQTAADPTAIRPFHFSAPEAALTELRRRISATRWPEKGTVDDDFQGVPLATLRELVRYWQTDYDWRKVEARLNTLSQLITGIDGLDIWFEPKPGEIVAPEHWCSSGFANTDLDLQLKKHGIQQLIIMGLIAHTCLTATVRFAPELGYGVMVARDATADYSDQEMHAALAVNIPRYATSIMTPN
jgi:hypothetical protein